MVGQSSEESTFVILSDPGLTTPVAMGLTVTDIVIVYDTVYVTFT